MFFNLFAVTLSLFGTIGFSAPIGSANGTSTTSLDAATLLKNGQTAQSQNALFQTLKTNDLCTAGETACVNSAQAECVDGKWTLTRCPRTSLCFAVPSIKEQGTASRHHLIELSDTLTCTSERSALSLINATGAQGGIAVAQVAGINSTTPANPPATPSSAANTTESSAIADAGPDAPRTVTVTVFPSSSSSSILSSSVPSNIISTDLPSQTLTVPPAEASAIISSLTASGASIVSIIQPSGAAAAFPIDAPEANAEKPAATTIKLTAAAMPVQTSVSAFATPANLNAPDVTADAGGYGYGY